MIIYKGVFSRSVPVMIIDERVSGRVAPLMILMKRCLVCLTQL